MSIHIEITREIKVASNCLTFASCFCPTCGFIVQQQRSLQVRQATARQKSLYDFFYYYDDVDVYDYDYDDYDYDYDDDDDYNFDDDYDDDDDDDDGDNDDNDDDDDDHDGDNDDNENDYKNGYKGTEKM